MDIPGPIHTSSLILTRSRPRTPPRFASIRQSSHQSASQDPESLTLSIHLSIASSLHVGTDRTPSPPHGTGVRADRSLAVGLRESRVCDRLVQDIERPAWPRSDTPKPACNGGTNRPEDAGTALARLTREGSMVRFHPRPPFHCVSLCQSVSFGWRSVNALRLGANVARVQTRTETPPAFSAHDRER